MERALVTGANGFVGANLVRALLARGTAVRAFLRRDPDPRTLGGLDLEIARGDLRDPDALRKALDGCDALFHCGAAYSLWRRDAQWMMESNVQGTVNILEAAREHGITRIVYTSSVAAIGKKKGPEPGNEDYQADPSRLISPYKRSKYFAEIKAMEFAERGLPVRIVNPSTPIGPYDAKPTPTGRILLDFLNGKVPAYLDTGLNLIDVGDCCAGHLLALEKGVPGRRYILGNRNLTLREIYGILAGLTGRRAPAWKIPHAVALAAGYCSELKALVTGRPPGIPVDGVRMARDTMYFDPSRAVTELGLPQTPVEKSLEGAVRWYTDNGYVRS